MDINEKHFEGKIHQNAVITTKNGKRVLIVRDHEDEKWELPGGRLNIGEKPIDGLRRELKEELGIEVEVGPIYHTQFLWHEKAHRENFLIMYQVFVPSEDVAFQIPSEELAEIQWVDNESYKQVDMYTDTRESLEAYFAL
jgi:8-oxo-dGTP diphosphatase